MKTALTIATVFGIALLLYGAWKAKPKKPPFEAPKEPLERPRTQADPTVDIKQEELP